MKSYKLPTVFPKKVITEKLAATDAEGAIRELVNLTVKADLVSASVVDDLVHALTTREREGSTGIGGGVAIPWTPNLSTSTSSSSRRTTRPRHTSRC